MEECWNKWATDKVTKATTCSGCLVKQASVEPTLEKLLVSQSAEMAEGSLHVLVGISEGNGSQTMLICAGTREVQKHTEIKAFWMAIIMLLRSSVVEEHLYHL